MPELSDVRYARTGDLYIAYRVMGEGPRDILLAPGFHTHVEQNFEWYEYAGFIADLAAFGRVIIFDRRGSGLSDRMRQGGNFEEAMDDIAAVLDAEGSERAVLAGFNEGAPLCAVYAAAHPQQVRSLVLFGSYAVGTARPDYPWAPTQETHDRVLEIYAERFARTPVAARFLYPTRAHDERWLRWLLRAQRYGSSPGAAIQWYRLTTQIDIRDILPAIQVPTLVAHRTGDRVRPIEGARRLAEAIPGAVFVELPGDDHAVGAGTDVLPLIEEFVTGEHTGASADRMLATVLFTDIVGSTELASAAGDRRWREILASHNSIVSRTLAAYGGVEIKTTGDGVVATFDRPARAIRCAVAVRDTLQADMGLDVRAALHCGEVEMLGHDIGGVAVHITARILGLAADREVLVSRTVRDLVAGSGISFEDRGEHALKGIDDRWQVLAVASS